MKICRKYLKHVQKSVFEGDISESKLKYLQRELENVILADQDSICIYCLNSVKYTNKIQIGRAEDTDTFL